MKGFTFLIGLIGYTIFGLSSYALKNTSSKTTISTIEQEQNSIDSVSYWSVKNLILNELVTRLGWKYGVKSHWRHMDKTGHRPRVISNVGYNFKASKNGYIYLNDEKELYGDLVKTDGSFRSHICSFKVVYPEKTVYARKSALDNWEKAADFAGRKKIDLKKSKKRR